MIFDVLLNRMDNLLIKIIVFLGISTILLGQNPKWDPAGTMPFGLSGAEAIAGDSLIYIFGGYLDSIQNVTNRIIAYNPAKNTWIKVGEMKRKRQNFVTTRQNNLVYIAGGELASIQSEGPLEIFSLSNYQSAIIDSNKRFNKIKFAGHVISNMFYIFGGIPYNNHGIKNAFASEYNISLKTFTNEYDSLFSGNRFWSDQMSFHYKNHIYLMGGIVNTIANHIYDYNIITHSLSRINSVLLQPRAGGVAVRPGDTNIVYLIGGFNEKNNTLSSVESYQIIDQNTVIRKTMPSLNIRRKDLMGVYFNNKIYVFGGTGEYNEHVYLVETLPVLTDVNEESIKIPESFSIKQNYPNPFNNSTNIEYTLKKPADVQLIVRDILGSEIKSYFFAGQSQGEYKISISLPDLSGGVYFYNMILNSSDGRRISETKKMILLK